MKYTGKAIITQIDYAQADKERFRRKDGSIEFVDGPIEPPSITFLLTDLKGETPDTINTKLAEFANGDGRVVITVEK